VNHALAHPLPPHDTFNFKPITELSVEHSCLKIALKQKSAIKHNQGTLICCLLYSLYTSYIAFIVSKRTGKRFGDKMINDDLLVGNGAITGTSSDLQVSITYCV